MQLGSFQAWQICKSRISGELLEPSRAILQADQAVDTRSRSWSIHCHVEVMWLIQYKGTSWSQRIVVQGVWRGDIGNRDHWLTPQSRAWGSRETLARQRKVVRAFVWTAPVVSARLGPAPSTSITPTVPSSCILPACWNNCTLSSPARRSHSHSAPPAVAFQTTSRHSP